MTIFDQIRLIFSQPDQEEVMAYQHKVPRSIDVNVYRDHDILIARVESIDDKKLSNDTFMTEAKSVAELTAEINDMLYSYLDFPDRIKSKMPRLIPPESMKLELEGASKSKKQVKVAFAK